MYILWRIAWWLLKSRLAINLMAQFIKFASLVDKKRGQKFLNRLKGLTRYPWKIRGWHNLHFSHFYTQVIKQLRDRKSIPQRKISNESTDPLRVGFVGTVSGLHRFSKNLFEEFPEKASLFVLELQQTDRDFAKEIEELATGYFPFYHRWHDQYLNRLEEAANFVNENRLDLLLTITYRSEIYDLLELIETPVIFHICTATEIMHHEKVSLQLLGQETTDFYIKENKIYSKLTRSYLSDHKAKIDARYHDLRGFSFESVLPLSQRDPTIMYHGSLYKIASSPYLRIIFNLLEDDNSLNFVFAGKDDDDSLSFINMQARKRGLQSRLHHIGYFTPPTTWNDTDTILTEWQTLVNQLKKSKLAPNPWPVGGGCTRFEAFAAGVPSIHMGNFCSVPYQTLDVPILQVHSGIAKSAEEYEKLCRKALYELDFANQLVTEQLAAAKISNDGERWWCQILDYYSDWIRNV